MALKSIPSTVDERLNAVARLHKPVTEWVVAIECMDGECDHEDGNHPEVPMTICGHCDAIRRDVNDEVFYEPWPCLTALAGGFDGLQP
jgi:hypothetical protein